MPTTRSQSIANFPVIEDPPKKTPTANRRRTPKDVPLPAGEEEDYVLEEEPPKKQRTPYRRRTPKPVPLPSEEDEDYDPEEEEEAPKKQRTPKKQNTPYRRRTPKAKPAPIPAEEEQEEKSDGSVPPKKQWKPWIPAKVTAIEHPKLPKGETPPIILCFDTETTDKPPDPKNPFEKQIFDDKEIPAENWPRILQLGFVLYDTGKQEIVKKYDHIVKLKQKGLIVPAAEKVHGISEEKSQSEGLPIKKVMMDFIHSFNQAKFVVGHNVQFDINVVLAELTLLLREENESEKLDEEEMEIVKEVMKRLLHPHNNYCTMQHAKPECKLPKLTYSKEGELVIDLITKKEVIDEKLDFKGQRKMRSPKLEVAHEILFQQKQNGKAHDAFVDVAICLRIFMKLYMDIDICDENNRSKNQLIYDTLKPTDLTPSQLPRRIGDKPVHPNVINRMNAIKFDKFDKEKSPTISHSHSPSPSLLGKELVKGISEKLTSLTRSIKKSPAKKTPTGRTPRGTRKARTI